MPVQIMIYNFHPVGVRAMVFLASVACSINAV